MTYDVIITCTSFYGQLPTQNFELRRTYGLGVRDTLFRKIWTNLTFTYIVTFDPTLAAKSTF